MSNAANTDGKYEHKETVIHGYKVELELFEEQGDERSDCAVTREVNGQEFGGSLGMLMGFGTLEDYRTGDEIVVEERIAAAIIKWAEDNGY
jgi:hypothetical protein